MKGFTASPLNFTFMKLSKQQIELLTEDLEMGMICFVHKQTGQIVSLIPEQELDVVGQEERKAWEKMKGKEEDYYQVEKMPSRDAFKIMMDFTAEVTDEGIKSKLLGALERRKPFRHFRNTLEYYGDVLEQWYVYKTQRDKNWYANRLKFLGDVES